MPNYDDDDDRPRKRRRDEDEQDDRPRKKKRRDDESAGDGGIGYVIPYKNGPALAAYYIGIFGLILCFLPPLSLFSGATAAVLGFMGMSRASKNPEAHGRGHAITGIILGVVQVLSACGVIGFFVVSIFANKR